MYKLESNEVVAIIIGNNVRSVRELTCYTQNQVAKNAGLSRSVYVDIERGVGVPKITTLLKVANFFNVEIERFLRGIKVWIKGRNCDLLFLIL